MQAGKKKIYFIHLLNDYSGSPNMGRRVIETFLQLGFSVQIITSDAGATGFLGEIKNVDYKIICYKWNTSSIVTLFRYLKAQIFTFLHIIYYPNQEDLIYVNTILPMGGIMAARLRGLKTICHIHEPYNSDKKFQSGLFFIIRHLNVYKIFVSKYTALNFEPLNTNSSILYNCVSKNFFDCHNYKKEVARGTFTVMMACSLKPYKGVFEFVKIASAAPEVNFKLVLNASKEEAYFFENEIIRPNNLTIEYNNRNIWEVMYSSDMVMNLSNPEEFVETFGLSLLEGLACGKPVIAPPIGGPTEFVEHAKNGFLINSRETEAIKSAIISLKENPGRYQEMSKNARETAMKFTQEIFTMGLSNILKIFYKE